MIRIEILWHSSATEASDLCTGEVLHSWVGAPVAEASKLSTRTGASLIVGSHHRNITNVQGGVGP